MRLQYWVVLPERLVRETITREAVLQRSDGAEIKTHVPYADKQLTMPGVTVVSTPNDGSCGIGTYTGELLESLSEDVTINWVTVPLRSMNPIPYAVAAVRAGLTDDRTVHVQHEYGIYGSKSLWSWVFFSLLLMLATARDRRVVITFHSAWNDETISPPLLPLKRVYVAVNNRLLAATADHAVFLSDNTVERFQRSVRFPSVETIPHGVQVETKEMSEATAKQHLGYEPEATLVVEPGYIRPEKGCDAFLDIARRFEIPFVLAGGCQSSMEYCESIRKRAPENAKITGELDDDAFHAAFIAADLIILPYREVTQSGVLNWCMAYGVPVLGSDRPYFRSLAEEWGCVETVDTEDLNATARRVRTLLSNENRRDSLTTAMADYRESVSMHAVADRHAEIYEA